VPAPLKLAYDLDASERFLAEYQAYEAQVGYDADAISSFFKAAKDKQLQLLEYHGNLSRWFYRCKKAMTIRKQDERRRHWQHVATLRRQNRAE
jgi:hypothetical protein